MALFAALRANRFVLLFIVLLLVLLAQALFYNAVVINIIMLLLYLNALLAALSANGATQRFRYALIALWMSSALLKFAAPPEFAWQCLVLAKMLSCILLSVLVFSIMRYVLFSRSVEGDTLFAAVVAYMLLAMMFAQMYSAIALLIPDSFTVAKALLSDSPQITDIDYNYFSFVTIATLGYGDMSPAHPLTQMLASIEAVIGQFYVAILVAWLVSVYVAHHQD